MFRKLLGVLLLPFCFVIISAQGHAQQVDPSYQIAWSTPITGQGPISQFYNGIPQADQFVGTPTNDFCGQLRAAELYAIAHNIGIVDASHYGRAVSCSSDPFVNIVTASTNAKLQVIMPAAVISATVPVDVNVDGLVLEGAGRLNTVWSYTGACSSNQVAFELGNTSGFVQFDTLKDFSIVTTTASGCNGYTFYMKEAHRNTIQNMSFWGNQYGFVTAGAVTDTFIKLHVSNQDAAVAGWAGYQTPTHGFYFGFGTSDATTDGTIIDIAAESVTGIGIECYYCVDMHFSAGTSESNGQGITVDPNSKFNVFTAMDVEGNTNTGTSGNDFLDTGGGNNIVGGIWASSCTACNSVTQTGAIGNDVFYGISGAQTGAGGLFNFIGDGTALANRAGLVMSTNQLNASIIFAPIFSSDGTQPASCTAGTGITSCTVAAGSTQARGLVTIVNASATTAQILGTVNWAATLGSAPYCIANQVGGSAAYGVNASANTTAHMVISNGATVSGVGTITVEYQCSL